MKLMDNILQLFDNFKCHNFPYINKNGEYCWSYTFTDRYYKEFKYHKYFDRWTFYYDKIVLIERIVRNYKDYCNYDREIVDYLDKIIRHRHKFIRKLYKLDIMDNYAHNLFLSTKDLEFPRLYREILELNLLKEKSRCLYNQISKPMLVTFLEKKNEK